ncbi:MAG: hypothetical protein KAI50_12275 [Desulfobacterales bacterium]|nr:hypothetical protein [Desulfobacterales bacterium]
MNKGKFNSHVPHVSRKPDSKGRSLAGLTDHLNIAVVDFHNRMRDPHVPGTPADDKCHASDRIFPLRHSIGAADQVAERPYLLSGQTGGYISI